MAIPFTKMQGLGNDFVVLDGVRNKISLTTDLIQKMSDRHLGIGFDQLLLISPSQDPNIDFEYRIFNADGSETGQCGNGARCVARFLWDTGLVLPDKTQIFLKTQTRLLEIHSRPDGQISVNMGVPELEPEKIPFQATSMRVRYAVELDGQTWEIGAVNVGNPHAVIVVDDIDAAPVDTVGKHLSLKHAAFPDGVNVGFMQCIDSHHIKLRVYERGAGETLACGSGACAAVIVGHLQGLLDNNVAVALPGGTLEISWLGGGHAVWMTGPAETVFNGEW